eukprot:TRINITY_DN541_c0_g1_i12.p1 TRINITY_DN541_c0_g1~~TRINITY_DN541_c0_g1_i12.p1  ORF type:complete len:228 (+),score=-29.37 TRINITY_DN541_c0_g1_i12:258-941(+)
MELGRELDSVLTCTQCSLDPVFIRLSYDYQGGRNECRKNQIGDSLKLNTRGSNRNCHACFDRHQKQQQEQCFLLQLFYHEGHYLRTQLTDCFGGQLELRQTVNPLIVNWLILPVVICLSQRLSHACLSINIYTVKLHMAHQISYSLFDGTLLHGQPQQFQSQYMRKVPTFWEGMYLLDKKPMLVLPACLMIHNNSTNRMASRRRQVIQISALSAFDGSVVDYHGFNG